VGMARAGVNDDVIISMMQSRGARLDLSPQGLISLKQSGVSDRVVLAAQNLGTAPAYVAGPPATVLVRPGPPAYYYHYPPPYCRSHVHYHIR
jgi:hypothetical protein